MGKLRVLGLDLGTKRIGVAVSDELGMLAQARCFIRRNKETSLEVKRLAEEENIGTIVVGLPLNMDGSEGPRALDSREVASNIEHVTGIKVVLWDERLSTREAEDIMIEADISRNKRKKSIDKLSAQLILQGYLDSLKV